MEENLRSYTTRVLCDETDIFPDSFFKIARTD